MSLITLADVKTFLQITSDDDDAILQMDIDLITAEVEAYTDRNLEEDTYTDEIIKLQRSNFDRLNTRPLAVSGKYQTTVLENYPCVSGVVIENDNVALTTTDYNVDLTNAVVTFFNSVSDSKFKLTSTYTAGYSSELDANYTTPKDLQLVLMEGVKRLYQSGGTATQGKANIKSKKVGDYSVGYGNNADTSNVYATQAGLVKAYLESNSIILNRYKKVRI
jgi:hypothetical protein